MAVLISFLILLWIFFLKVAFTGTIFVTKSDVLSRRVFDHLPSCLFLKRKALLCVYDTFDLPPLEHAAREANC